MKQEYTYVEILDNFTKDMRKKRLKMGMTQKELAKSVGVFLQRQFKIMKMVKQCRMLS